MLVQFCGFHDHAVFHGFGNEFPSPFTHQFAMIGEDEERANVSSRLVVPGEHLVAAQFVVGDASSENRAGNLGRHVLILRRDCLIRVTQ